VFLYFWREITIQIYSESQKRVAPWKLDRINFMGYINGSVRSNGLESMASLSSQFVSPSSLSCQMLLINHNFSVEFYTWLEKISYLRASGSQFSSVSFWQETVHNSHLLQNLGSVGIGSCFLIVFIFLSSA
jgi:hypothetical protein